MNIDLLDYEQYQHTVKNSKGNIMFLHGYTSSFQNYVETLKTEFPEYNIYAINVPGHGNSKWFDIEQLNMNYYAQVYKTYIEYLKLKKVILIGHSMGGGIAVLLNGIINPKIIDKNILINPANRAILKNELHIKKMIPSKLEDTQEVIKSCFYDYQKYYGSEEQFLLEAEKSYKNLTTKQKHLSAMINSDLMKNTMEKVQENILKLNNNSYLIVGENDKLVLTKETIKNFQINPLVNIFIIKKSGHMIQENHGDFFETIKNILK